MIIVRNIRVVDLIRVLGNYNSFQFVDIAVVIGKDNAPDQIKVSRSGSSIPTSGKYEKFKLKNLNDYI